jgi:tetratricopeptide (TPR) repeat protein
VTNAEALRREQIIDDAVAVGDLRRAEVEANDYCSYTEALPEDGAMSPRFRARYIAAQVDLAAGRLRAALHRIDTLVPLSAGLSPELVARLHLMAAEASARLRCEDEARAQLALVPDPPLTTRPLLRLRALRIRLWLGDLALIGDGLRACARDLESTGDTANLALLLSEQGRALDRAGNVPAALDCWRRADNLTQSDGDSAIRADVLVQLGRIDHLRGRLGDALEHFDDACRCAAAGPHAVEAMLRRALVRLELGRREQAAAEVAHLLGGAPDSLPEELRPLAEMTRYLLADGKGESAVPYPLPANRELEARAAARRGDVVAARDLYAVALAAEPSPERRARLALALGMLAAAGPDAGEARAWLGEAEALARSQDLPEVLIRVLQMGGQLAAEQEGDDALAREFFKKVVLISELQAERFRNIVDLNAYRQLHGSVLRHLIRSACRRGDAARVFEYQELERGRLLLDLLQTDRTKTPGLSLFMQPEFIELEKQIAACDQVPNADDPDVSSGKSTHGLRQERQELLLQRDRLFEGFLSDRGRRSDALLPALPKLADLQRSLPAGTIYIAPSLTANELYVLTVTRSSPARVIPVTGSATALAADLESWRGCLADQLADYRHGLQMRSSDRRELDDRLESLGRGPLGIAIKQALEAQSDRPRRVLWAPDDLLHGFPIHALRIGGRYLIEDFEFVWTFSGALQVHQARRRKRRRSFFRPALVVAEKARVLPEAEREGEGVAATFFRSQKPAAEAVNRKSCRSLLARARVAHFACHAEFDGERPLAARLMLPSGEPIHALEWLEEPVAGLPLVTLSACRSAEVAPLMGREVFGLVTGLLAGGVGAVLAGLWSVTDHEVPPLMWRFYRHRLLHELPTALALAQRETLEAPGSSPLFWAVFALFGDGNALPAPGILGRFFARRRFRRHQERFPT